MSSTVYLPHKKQKSFWRKIFLIAVLYAVFVFATGLYTLLVLPVRAASSPWNQTDWSGGVGASTVNQYASATDINATGPGSFQLAVKSDWYDASWLYRKKITIDNSAQAENLTDFPLMVRITGGAEIDYTKTKDAGEDIRFTDSDGTTLLDYEIERWDEAGTSTLWVRVPQINASSNTDHVYMYYGNTAASDAQNAGGVWATSYRSVYHMNQNPAGSAPQMTDSSGNANHGTTAGTMIAGNKENGQIGEAIHFDGTNDRVEIGSQAALNGATALTVEAWMYQDTTPGGYRGVVGQLNGANAWYIHTSNAVNQRILMGVGNTTGSCGIDTGYVGAWTHVALVFDGAGATNTDRLKIYVNGALQAATCVGTIATSVPNVTASTAAIADLIGFNRYFDGLLDEVRIATQTNSAARMAAEYLSQTDAYASYGAEEGRYPNTGILTSNIFDSNVVGSIWGQLDYIASGAGTVSARIRTSNDSGMSGAPAFNTCAAITNNTDISGNNCVTDSDRYVQYEVTLTPSASTLTPVFEDFSLAFVGANNPPDTPTGTSPAAAATAISRNPTLTASAYSDTEPDPHTNTQWQLDDNNDFSSPEWTRTAGSAEVTTLVNAANGTFGGSLSGKTKLTPNTTYYWRVRYSDASNYSAYSTATSFTTNVIVTPTNTSPGNTQVASSATPTLVASAFSDQEVGPTHASSQWQVDDAVDFATPIHDSGEIAAGVSYAVPSNILNNFVIYYWRVRYKNSDGEWSAYSSGTSFSVNTSLGSVLLQPVGWNQTYSIGDTASFTMQTMYRDSGGAFLPQVADTAPTYRLRYWDGAAWVELVASSNMTTSGAPATYAATYAIPSDSAWIGRKVAVIFQATVNGIQESISREIEIVGSPAQVLITSMSSVETPNIGANVTISNEGSASFEYLYEYCVVTVSTNVCGGGDDVAYASAAKLIAAGSDFITTLNHTVATPGAYFFKVTVWWSAQSSTAQLGFTATEGAQPASGSAGSPFPAAVVPSSSTDAGVGTGLLADIFRKNAEIVAKVLGMEERLNGLEDRVRLLEQQRVSTPATEVVPSEQPRARSIYRIRLQ